MSKINKNEIIKIENLQYFKNNFFIYETANSQKLEFLLET